MTLWASHVLSGSRSGMSVCISLAPTSGDQSRAGSFAGTVTMLMSWTRKISHPSEMLEKGQEVTCKILSVDTDRRRIALGLKQMAQDPWATDIPSRYQPGQVVRGKVTKITTFGVFVGLEDGLEGLLHISELADHKVDNPESVVKVGEEVEVKVLRVDTEDRKIGLSRRRVDWSSEEEAAANKTQADADKAQQELKGGRGSAGPLIG